MQGKCHSPTRLLTHSFVPGPHSMAIFLVYGRCNTRVLPDANLDDVLLAELGGERLVVKGDEMTVYYHADPPCTEEDVMDYPFPPPFGTPIMKQPVVVTLKTHINIEAYLDMQAVAAVASPLAAIAQRTTMPPQRFNARTAATHSARRRTACVVDAEVDADVDPEADLDAEAELDADVDIDLEGDVDVDLDADADADIDLEGDVDVDEDADIDDSSLSADDVSDNGNEDTDSFDENVEDVLQIAAS